MSTTRFSVSTVCKGIMLFALVATVLMTSATKSYAGLTYSFAQSNHEFPELSPTPAGTLTISNNGVNSGVIKLAFTAGTNPMPGTGFSLIGLNLSNSLSASDKEFILSKAAEAILPAGWSIQPAGSIGEFGQFALRFGQSGVQHGTGVITISGLGQLADNLYNFVEMNNNDHIVAGLTKFNNDGGTLIPTNDPPMTQNPEFEIPLPAGFALMASGIVCWSAGAVALKVRRRRQSA